MLNSNDNKDSTNNIDNTNKNMEEEQNTEEDQNTNEIPEELESFFDNLDISLAEIEKTGTILLCIGYSNFYVGADLDILEALNVNYTGTTPDDITLLGQQLVLIGYILLWFVATKRVEEKSLRNTHKNDNYYLEAYSKVSYAYFLSVFANSIRLQAFSEIAYLINTGQFTE